MNIVEHFEIPAACQSAGKQNTESQEEKTNIGEEKEGNQS